MPGQYFEWLMWAQDFTLWGVPFWFWFQYFGGAFPISYRSFIPAILWIVFFEPYFWNHDRMEELLGREYLAEIE